MYSEHRYRRYAVLDFIEIQARHGQGTFRYDVDILTGHRSTSVYLTDLRMGPRPVILRISLKSNLLGSGSSVSEIYLVHTDW